MCDDGAESGPESDPWDFGDGHEPLSDAESEGSQTHSSCSSTQEVGPAPVLCFKTDLAQLDGEPAVLEREKQAKGSARFRTVLHDIATADVPVDAETADEPSWRPGDRVNPFFGIK